MHLPPWIFGVASIVSIITEPTSRTKDLENLRLVTGIELTELVVSSTMGYGDPPPKGAGFSVFRADRHYKFYGSESWGAEGPYRVDFDQVCVDTSRPWCFKVYANRKHRYFIVSANGAADQFQSVTFHHLQPGERI